MLVFRGLKRLAAHAFADPATVRRESSMPIGQERLVATLFAVAFVTFGLAMIYMGWSRRPKKWRDYQGNWRSPGGSVHSRKGFVTGGSVVLAMAGLLVVHIISLY